MRRWMMALPVVAGLAGAGLWRLDLPPFAGPRAEFRLTAAGKGDVIYSCRLTSTEDEARSRAETTHETFQVELKKLAKAAAADMQTGMAIASINNDTSGIKAANEAYRAKVIELRADLEKRFGCRVDSTLQDPSP